MPSYPRLDFDETRTPSEREFLDVLHARAEAGSWFGEAWPRDDKIIITASPSDRERNCVLRTLRIDFDGTTLTLGDDETHQLVTDLDPARPGVLSRTGFQPGELAHFAADWLEKELRRVIERHEWVGFTFRHASWILADSGVALMFSDSQNKRRENLGNAHSIVKVWPP